MGSPPLFALTSLNPGDVIHGGLHSPGSCYRIADVCGADSRSSPSRIRTKIQKFVQASGMPLKKNARKQF